MAGPGLSSQAFLTMLDQHTLRFGRVSTTGNNCMTQDIVLRGHYDRDRKWGKRRHFLHCPSLVKGFFFFESLTLNKNSNSLLLFLQQKSH